MSCSRSWEVRAIDEGRLAAPDVAAFERHARGCSLCLEERAALEQLRTLTRQLRSPGPSELELRRLRARVLRDAMSASSPPRRRVAVAALGAAAVAAALLLVVLRTRTARPVASEDEPFGAVVTPGPQAHWTQSHDGPVERVDLGDGELQLQVQKQAVGRRFLVLVPDGEIEVRGTIFDVSVHGGKTARVHVDEGVVIVRVHGESVLSGGETWSPPPTEDPASKRPELPSAALPQLPSPVIDAPQGPAPPAPRSRPRAKGQSPAGSERQADAPEPVGARDGEMAEYERAIDAYRLGRFEQAAELLRVFQSANPSSALLDDASFIEASSRASAGQPEAAARLAERHLLRFPASFHHKDAAILVARIRRDRDDCTGARAVLAPWLAKPGSDPAVVSALGRCAESR